MRLKVLVNDADYSDAALVEQTRISKELSGRVSTAEISFISGREGARYDEARYDEAVYGVDAAELSRIDLRNADTNELLFSGFIVETKRSLWAETPDTIQIDCTCADWTSLLDAVIPSATFSGQTDRAIVQALISTYAPKLTALTANVVSTQTVSSFEVKDSTLRDALTELRDLTGCEFRVDFSRNFHWFVEGAFPAPFSLSTDREEYSISDYTRDAKGVVNRCVVLGGVLEGGAELRVQYDHPISQSIYGLRETTVIDRQIMHVAEAILRAQLVVQENAFPLESGSAVTLKDGLDIGHSVTLLHEQLSVSGTYLIRSIEMKWWPDGETVEHTFEFGKPRPSLERIIRMLDARNRRATEVPTAVPAPGSITDDSFGSGGVNAGLIRGTITGVNVTVDAAIVSGIIAGSSVTVDAGTLQGVITGPNIAVDTTTFEGVIVSDQVADNLINRLSMYADQFRPIAIRSTAPSLPDPNYPVGSFYRNSTTSKFFRNDSGVWTEVSESTAVAGKLELYHVGTIRADKIIGLIAATSIGEIAASQIIGTLEADQIGEINATAVTLTGQWKDGDIESINASKLDAGIVDAAIEMTSPLITGGQVLLTHNLVGFAKQYIDIKPDDDFIRMWVDPVGGSLAPVETVIRPGSMLFKKNSTQNAIQMGVSATTGGYMWLFDGPTNTVKFDIGTIAPFTSASAGAIQGYINVSINGTPRKIPFHAV